MLNTLLKIGEWQSQGKSEWDRFLDYPKIERVDKYGNPIRNYTLPIIFDLDIMEIIISQENLREYDEEKIKTSFPLKIKGGNNKAIYTAVPAGKINQIYKTFYGKEEANTKNGELTEAIEKTNQGPEMEDLKKILDRVFALKEKFLELTVHPIKGLVDVRAITESFDLGKSENIVFITVLIKAQELGYNEPTPFADIKEYIAFLHHSFFGNQNDKASKKAQKKLCYASGEQLEDVQILNISSRYGLNKMFVTTTKNYLSEFNEAKIQFNYQVDLQNQKFLDVASEFLLKKGFVIRIANIEHVIIPQFLNFSHVDLEMALNSIQKKSDILFNLKEFNKFSKNIRDEVEAGEVFWLNFIAFDTDRKGYFKSTEIIKDISNFHFEKLIRYFIEIDWEFRKSHFVNWNAVMTERDYQTKEFVQRNLNFNSLFRIIPLRKDKENKNKVLNLFKTILENRKVNTAIIYNYFVELILCHYYRRYESYTNTHKYDKDYFFLAVRDSVFKYHAFIQFLLRLNLIEMDPTTNPTEEKSENKYEQAVQEFFSKMSLNPDQQAMFYLGRMLNTVEYIQKGKTKTVIQKVNFNGMDKDDIQRLRISLIEKAKQYNSIGKVIFTDKEFGKHFSFNDWKLNPQEAVFFLLTGYSFGVGVKDAEQLTEKETQETI
jgi:CRISPR-associated protein Csh1